MADYLRRFEKKKIERRRTRELKSKLRKASKKVLEPLGFYRKLTRSELLLFPDDIDAGNPIYAGVAQFLGFRPESDDAEAAAAADAKAGKGKDAMEIDTAHASASSARSSLSVGTSPSDNGISIRSISNSGGGGRSANGSLGASSSLDSADIASAANDDTDLETVARMRMRRARNARFIARGFDKGDYQEVFMVDDERRNLGKGEKGPRPDIETCDVRMPAPCGVEEKREFIPKHYNSLANFKVMQTWKNNSTPQAFHQAAISDPPLSFFVGKEEEEEKKGEEKKKKKKKKKKGEEEEGKVGGGALPSGFVRLEGRDLSGLRSREAKRGTYIPARYVTPRHAGRDLKVSIACFSN